MNETVTLFVSLGVTVVLMLAVTAIVSEIVRRAPSTSTWKARRDGVLFVVNLRRWQRVLIRVIGVAVLVVGALMFLVAITDDSGDPILGMGIAGVVMIVAGALLLWLAHGMARMRLEVSPDTLWVFRMAGAPREFALGDVTALSVLRSNNFGGVVIRAGHRTVFNATRVMLGYPQLIEFFRTSRPDLPIPDASLPL